MRKSLHISFPGNSILLSRKLTLGRIDINADGWRQCTEWTRLPESNVLRASGNFIFEKGAVARPFRMPFDSEEQKEQSQLRM